MKYVVKYVLRSRQYPYVTPGCTEFEADSDEAAEKKASELWPSIKVRIDPDDYKSVELERLPKKINWKPG